jgi:trans-aconitate methyltransferase
MTKTAYSENVDWDAHWQDYDTAARSNPAQIYRHETVLRLLADLPGQTPSRLLDIGSGQGDFLVKAAARLPDVELGGLEMAESGVRISRQKVPGAKLAVADLFQPSAELAEFHGWGTRAVCCEVLEHVDDPTAFLQAARVYLADDADLIVTVPGGPMSAFDKHIGHRQHFTRASIARVLTGAGFDVRRVCLAGFPFFNLYRLTVIARGARLIEDVRAGQGGSPSRFALGVMAAYRALFRLNFLDSALGWQVVAVARKARR